MTDSLVLSLNLIPQAAGEGEAHSPVWVRRLFGSVCGRMEGEWEAALSGRGGARA